MTLLAALSLDDLDLGDTNVVEPDYGPFRSSATDWGLWRQWQPSDVGAFPLDFLARMHDTGVAYSVLLGWVHHHRFDCRPTRTSIMGMTRPVPPAEESLGMVLALTREPDESERGHLLRLGHQVAVWDQPNLRTRLRGEHRTWWSIFMPRDSRAVPSVATQCVMATSPVTADRIVVAERRVAPRSVLVLLARDPSPLIRRAVARHRKADATVLRRFTDLDTRDGYVEPHQLIRRYVLTHHRTDPETVALLDPITDRPAPRPPRFARPVA